MIGQYLNQTAILKRVVDRNEYGEPVTQESTIRVRWEGRRRLVRDRQGKEVVSEAQVFCIDIVQAGDHLLYDGREWPVIAVSELPSMDGRLVYRKVAV